MKERILEILHDIKPDMDFEASEDFFEDELLDSFDIMTLIDAVESEYGIEFGGDDIIPENFVNLCAIENIINQYM